MGVCRGATARRQDRGGGVRPGLLDRPRLRRARLNPNGSLDPSFGNDTAGKSIVAFDRGGGNSDEASAVALEPDGRIVVAGYAQSPAGDEDFAVARLNPNGLLDPSFGTAGKAIVAFDRGGSNYDWASAVALQPDGKIVAAGAAISTAHGYDFAVARLNPNGLLDPSFGTAGKAIVAFDLGGGNSDEAYAVALQPDGKIVVAGAADISSFDIDFAVARLNTGAATGNDYNGDGKAELAVFRPSTAQWIIAGVGVYQFGAGNLYDIPVPGDYNGDGKAELAVFRPSTAQWIIAGVGVYQFGAGNLYDIPVPGDYNGDGKAELAVFRPSTAQWIIAGVGVYQFGAGNLYDIPVPGDYNGDGKAELAVFRPSTAQWIIAGVGVYQFGAGNLYDIPVPGDYNGDGKAELAVFRPSTAQWIIAGVGVYQFGAGNLYDIPLEAPIASLVRLGRVPTSP